MKIGALAKETGTTVETIRYYEREGLLGPHGQARSEGNYRLYGPAAVQRLAFIRHCRALDMTLAEIRTLLHSQDAPEADCARINTLLDEHIGHVSARIRQLRTLQQQLKALRAQCAATDTVDQCGILNELVRLAVAEPARATGAEAHISGSHAPPQRVRKA